ncbi:hypothetical protein [Oceanobacillus damuensis]|uniref:hypothetical protein n=1 Tax=Oceanobacillus damuensis TaxID=937928 RepID=UPI000832E76F|nr:hypothetical protein [Oceanobacillus damuensis]
MKKVVISILLLVTLIGGSSSFRSEKWCRGFACCGAFCRIFIHSARIVPTGIAVGEAAGAASLFGN